VSGLIVCTIGGQATRITQPASQTAPLLPQACEVRVFHTHLGRAVLHSVARVALADLVSLDRGACSVTTTLLGGA
jgi:peroxiredoxin family protein